MESISHLSQYLIRHGVFNFLKEDLGRTRQYFQYNIFTQG